MRKKLSLDPNSHFLIPIFLNQMSQRVFVQTINSDGSNNQSLKHQSFILSGWKDMKIKKSEFAAKTQFLSLPPPIMLNMQSTYYS